MRSCPRAHRLSTGGEISVMSKKMTSILKHFARNVDGLETVEYAIIAGVIVVGTLAAIVAISVWVNLQFEAMQSSLGA